MSKLPIFDSQGSRLGDFELADNLLETKRGAQVVHDAVETHRANLRSGTAKTKKRGEVSGGGAKPWKQKGTGRARAGSNRSPIWRGGGVVFGPNLRSYNKKLNRKAGHLAFRRAFSDKVAAGEVIIVDQIAVPEAKTRLVAELLKKIKADRGALLVVDKSETKLVRAARNIPGVAVEEARNVHTFQVLRFPMLAVSKGAMDIIQARLKQYAGSVA